MRRLEDGRLLRGEGRFTADVVLPGALEARIVRSPHAHAGIRGLDGSAARAVPGVVAVWAAADLSGLDARMPMIIPDRRIAHPRTPAWLASDVVRYVGEPVAVVIAETRHAAEDAAERVVVDYEPRLAVSALRHAVRPAAVRVHPEAEGNVAARDAIGFGDVDAALRGAAVVVRQRFELSRGSSQALETRSIVARWDAVLGQLTVWDSTQAPVPVRNALAHLLGLERDAVRVIAGDVGGGFGPKMALYAEEVLVPYAAIRLGRPVRWVETRRESFLATTSEREQIHDVVAGADAAGRLLALQDHFHYETGAYIPYGLNIPFVTTMHLLGLYRIPALQASFEAIFTHRMFVSPYRGAGRPYAAFVIERILDRIAARLGLDRAEIRRRNLITRSELPFRTPLTYWDGGPLEYDSGDFEGLLDDALDRLGYDAARADQVRERRRGRYLGIGLACYAEATAIGPYEGARVRVDPDGRVQVTTAVGSQGQGHQTTLARVVAQRLGVAAENIAVIVGDSAAFDRGIGTFASRGAVTAGNAAAAAADRVAATARQWAAEALECSADDLVLAGGRVHVKGAPDRGVSLGELASRADPGRGRIPRDPASFRPGLEAEAFFNPQQATIASGVHACVVEVDPDTGATWVLRYVAAHDCGNVLDSRIVEGQVTGGIAQGIGGALLERLAYDDAGQLLTGSLLDYALPRATDIPPVSLVHRAHASPHNPLGVKGVGEAGTIPGHAVIASAVEDALAPFGVAIDEMPLTSSRLYELIQAARARGSNRTSGRTTTEESA